MTFGEQTTNEMCFVFLGSTSDSPGRSPFMGPFGGRRRFRDPEPETPHKAEKQPQTQKPATPKSEPVTKN